MRRKSPAKHRLDSLTKSSNARAKARGQLAALRPLDVAEAFKSQQQKCAYCAANATTLDHFIPISKNGVSAIWNIVPSCRKCNMKKGATLPSECVRLRLFPGDIIEAITDRLLAKADSLRLSALSA